MKLSFQNLLMYNNKEIYVSQTLLFHLSKYNNIKILSYQIFIQSIQRVILLILRTCQTCADKRIQVTNPRLPQPCYNNPSKQAWSAD